MNASQGMHINDRIELYQRIGRITRELHDTLKELGQVEIIDNAAAAIPDASQRLAYVVQKTEQAASTVLNAVDVVTPAQDRIGAGLTKLTKACGALSAEDLANERVAALHAAIQQFSKSAREDLTISKTQLLDIMMAQEFQDITGQVIIKVLDLVQNTQQKLLTLLLDASSSDGKPALMASDGLLNGPVINPAQQSNVVTGQDQVDDLLDSLGF